MQRRWRAHALAARRSASQFASLRPLSLTSDDDDIDEEDAADEAEWARTVARRVTTDALAADALRVSTRRLPVRIPSRNKRDTHTYLTRLSPFAVRRCESRLTAFSFAGHGAVCHAARRRDPARLLGRGRSPPHARAHHGLALPRRPPNLLGCTR